MNKHRPMTESRRDFVVKSLSLGTAAMLGPLPFAEAAPTSEEAVAWRTTAAAIIRRIRDPIFQNLDVNILEWGAKAVTPNAAGVVGGPDGAFDSSDAIAAAILACHNAGGGRVVVPSGTFLTGPIRLLSNVNLCLINADSILVFSTNLSKYPNVLTRWEGNDVFNYSPLVYAFRETNIAITGLGILDGQAGATVHEQGTAVRSAWLSFTSLGATTDSNNLKVQGSYPGKVPVSQRIYGIDGSGKQHFLRPPLIGPYGCENVMIQGVTLHRTPFWQMTPLLCKNVIIRGVTASSLGANNDGCDPESCTDVLIERCTFDTGDDCIAIKAGRGYDAMESHGLEELGALPPWASYPTSTQNVIIRDCVMQNGHGGVTLGSEMSGGINNVFAENLQMLSSSLDIALRFKSNTWRGGFMTHYYARNINVPNGVSANSGVITIDYFYTAGTTDNPQDGGPFKPFTDHIFISNLVVGRGKNKGTKVFNIRGLAATPGPNPLPPNYVSNTPMAPANPLSHAINDPIGWVQVSDSVFNVSTTPDVLQNADVRLSNVTVNRS